MNYFRTYESKKKTKLLSLWTGNNNAKRNSAPYIWWSSEWLNQNRDRIQQRQISIFEWKSAFDSLTKESSFSAEAEKKEINKTLLHALKVRSKRGNKWWKSVSNRQTAQHEKPINEYNPFVHFQFRR